MGCLKKEANTGFSFPYNSGCETRTSTKLLDSYKAPTQPQECYDWFHKISSTFTQLITSELLQHKTISEKDWIPRQQIQSDSRMF